MNTLNTLQLSDFNYEYPSELIAVEPCSPRDHSKLLVRMPNDELSDSVLIDDYFYNLSDYIPENTLLILNNSRVFQARVYVHTENSSKIEFLFIEPEDIGLNIWKVLAKPAKKLKPQNSFTIKGQSSDLNIKILDFDSTKIWRRVEINLNADEFFEWLELNGNVPLPPYIKKTISSNQTEKINYQTIYAQNFGSSAAPTAGLHFSPEVLKSLANKGVNIATVCLHVGAGTFLPVKTSNINEHSMHEERFLITKECSQQILDAKQCQKKILCVGTTSFRAVESFFINNLPTDTWNKTDLFIYPKNKDYIYRSEVVDGIITNFHQPQSTLLMLISALIGWENTQKIYQHAINNHYRLFSYGDSSLLWF